MYLDHEDLLYFVCDTMSINSSFLLYLKLFVNKLSQFIRYSLLNIESFVFILRNFSCSSTSSFIKLSIDKTKRNLLSL